MLPANYTLLRNVPSRDKVPSHFSYRSPFSRKIEYRSRRWTLSGLIACTARGTNNGPLFFICRAGLWRKFIWPRASAELAVLPRYDTARNLSACSLSGSSASGNSSSSSSSSGGGGGGGSDVGADGVAPLPEKRERVEVGGLPSRLTPFFYTAPTPSPRFTPGRQANQTVRVNCSPAPTLPRAPLKKLKYSVLAPPSTNPRTADATVPFLAAAATAASALHRSSVRSPFVVLVVVVLVVATLLDFIITISSRHLPSLSPRSYPRFGLGPPPRASFLRGRREEAGAA